MRRSNSLNQASPVKHESRIVKVQSLLRYADLSTCLSGFQFQWHHAGHSGCLSCSGPGPNKGDIARNVDASIPGHKRSRRDTAAERIGNTAQWAIDDIFVVFANITLGTSPKGTHQNALESTRKGGKVRELGARESARYVKRGYNANDRCCYQKAASG